MERTKNKSEPDSNAKRLIANRVIGLGWFGVYKHITHTHTGMADYL